MVTESQWHFCGGVGATPPEFELAPRLHPLIILYCTKSGAKSVESAFSEGVGHFEHKCL